MCVCVCVGVCVGEPIDCTRKWIGNAAYIVYVTSLAILRTVTARGKLAGVTNDYSGPCAVSQWVSPYCSTQTGSEALLLVLQGMNIDTYTIHKSDAWVFSIF